MEEFERKQILAKQVEEQYLSIGKFVVHFEHLFSALKSKIASLCSWSEEVHLLLEPFSVRQTIDSLKDLIKIRLEEYNVDEKDVALYNFLIKDLTKLNVSRNMVIHTTWYIGWQSKESTDISNFIGDKFSSRQNKKYRKLTSKEIDILTEKCKILYRIFFTIWSIDIIEISRDLKLHEIWSRDAEGNWKDIRVKQN